MSEASTKIPLAIQHSNIQSVKVAQMMLKAGNDKLHETSNILDVIQSNQLSLCEWLNSGCGNEDKFQTIKKN